MIGIILVNYNGWRDTLVCLNSILTQDYENYHIVIVDNKSTDDSVNQIYKWINELSQIELMKSYDNVGLINDSMIISNSKYKQHNRIVLIQANENRGFSAGNNIGIFFLQKEFGCNYIWLLNNDTTIEKDSIVSLVHRMGQERTKNSKIGILGSKIMEFYGENCIQSIGFKYNKLFSVSKPIGKGEIDIGQYDIEQIDADFVMGASMFVDINFINEVGLMSEDYFLFFEELDWILRGKKIGWGFGYEYKSKIYHKQGGSTGLNKQGRNEFFDFYQIKNRLLFTYKFYPLYLTTLYPALVLSLIKRLINKEFIAAKNTLKLMLNFK